LKYGIVFCDIDGTLVGSESHAVSAGTIRKVRELDSAGIPFVLVSARMPSGIAPIRESLGISAPIICYSGALILGENGERLASTGIARETAILISEYIRRDWVLISCGAFSYDDWLVAEPQDKWVRQEREITSSVPIRADIAGAVPNGGCVHKFLCMGEPEHIAALGPKLKERFPGISAYRSKDTYLEVMAGAATKSSAVRFLCGRYGIPAEAAVSFGDNYNDADMLQATGMSFAMGNAPEAIKRLAKAVTLDNDREGVLAGLNRLDFARDVKFAGGS
jgi:Cof subfamily protein (haloacid dehalogenase superfamily)